jgi:hypothetical protein
LTSLSTLEKGNPVYIPLKANTYTEKVKGEFLNYCQIIEDDNGNIEFRIIKKQLKKKEYVPATDEIAIDLEPDAKLGLYRQIFCYMWNICLYRGELYLILYSLLLAYSKGLVLSNLAISRSKF